MQLNSTQLTDIIHILYYSTTLHTTCTKSQVKIEKVVVQEVLGPQCYVGRVRLKSMWSLSPSVNKYSCVCAQDGGVLLIICMVVVCSNGY